MNAGDQVNLDCEVRQSERESLIQWYHQDESGDTRIISHGSSVLTQRTGYSLGIQDGVDSTTHHWVLSINSLDANRDTGTWRCAGEGLQEQTLQLLILGKHCRFRSPSE